MQEIQRGDVECRRDRDVRISRRQPRNEVLAGLAVLEHAVHVRAGDRDEPTSIGRPAERHDDPHRALDPTTATARQAVCLFVRQLDLGDMSHATEDTRRYPR